MEYVLTRDLSFGLITAIDKDVTGTLNQSKLISIMADV
jgi:hypothetical protein